MNIKLELPQLTDLKPRLTVIGVGGAGCNAVNNMIAAGLTGVEFVVANTDAQTLEASSAEHRIQLGMNLTEGLGAGANPEIGAAAAEEAIDEIKSQISGSHMLFLAAGMGGGTGTGAISIIARASREMGILTVGVVTKPFQFEGSRRMRMAEAGIQELRQHVDTLIVIPNQNLFRVANEKTTFAEAFLLADQVLYSGVACIVDLIVREGLINLDFADVRAVMRNMGTAMMGTGEGTGERRAITAAEEAIANPLLDDVSLQGAKGLALVDHRRPGSDALRSRRSRIPRSQGSRSGSQHHRWRHLRRHDGRPRSRLDRRFRDAQRRHGKLRHLRAPAACRASTRFATTPIRHRARRRTFRHRRRCPPVPSQPMASPEKQGGPEKAPVAPAASGQKSNAPWPDTEQSRPQPPAAPRAAQPGSAPLPTAVPENTSPIWRSAEGVTIEAGPDALKQRPVPPPPPAAPTPPAAARGTSENTFRPQQTEDIHRRTRRMPEVEDFPPSASATTTPSAIRRRMAPPKIKPVSRSLASRAFSNASQAAAASQVIRRKPRTRASSNVTNNAIHRPTRMPAEPNNAARLHRTATPDDDDQDVDLPVFFSTDQGRR